LYLDAPQQRFKALAIIDVSVVASFVRGEDKLVLVVVGLIFEPQVTLMGIYIYIYKYIYNISFYKGRIHMYWS